MAKLTEEELTEFYRQVLIQRPDKIDDDTRAMWIVVWTLAAFLTWLAVAIGYAVAFRPVAPW